MNPFQLGLGPCRSSLRNIPAECHKRSILRLSLLKFILPKTSSKGLKRNTTSMILIPVNFYCFVFGDFTTVYDFSVSFDSSI